MMECVKIKKRAEARASVAPAERERHVQEQ